MPMPTTRFPDRSDLYEPNGFDDDPGPEWQASSGSDDAPPISLIWNETGPWSVSKLADHPPEAPRAPLAGLIAPGKGDLTLLYGHGGSGKGILAAELISRVTGRLGKVLLVDAEGHLSEWSRRISGLGGDATLVTYARHTGGLMQIELLGGLSRYALIVVDSAAYFRSDGDDWGPDGPVQMQQQASWADIPMLVLAHAAKGQPGARTSPYGSVFWHNVPRVVLELAREAPGTQTTLTVRKATDIVGLTPGDSFEVELETGPDGITPEKLSISSI